MSIRSTAVVLEAVTLEQNVKRLWVGGLNPGSLVARNLFVIGSTDATAAIILESNGELTIDGGQIIGGVTGIADVAAGSKVHLKNVLITGTTQRALDLPFTTGELDFSTIADAGTAVQGAPCAVNCNANLRVTSSIVWQQTCGGAPRDAAGPCTFNSSIVSNAPAPGIMNVDPQFVNPAMRDYHITATSPAKDAVDMGPAIDFEGDARPRGTKYDIGADEAP